MSSGRNPQIGCAQNTKVIPGELHYLNIVYIQLIYPCAYR